MSEIGDLISIEKFYEVIVRKYNLNREVVLERIFHLDDKPSEIGLEAIFLSIHENEKEYKNCLIMDYIVNEKYRGQFKLF